MGSSKQQRRMSREQVQEILERNATLCRDEPNFIRYVVDLAIYLLEYEYDWKDCGIEPPERIATRPLPGDGTLAPVDVAPPRPAPAETHATPVETRRPLLQVEPPPAPEPVIPIAAEPRRRSGLLGLPPALEPRPKVIPEVERPAMPSRPAPAESAPREVHEPAKPPAHAASEPRPGERQKFVSLNLRQTSKLASDIGPLCVYCGVPVGDHAVCPSCRNVVR